MALNLDKYPFTYDEYLSPIDRANIAATYEDLRRQRMENSSPKFSLNTIVNVLSKPKVLIPALLASGALVVGVAKHDTLRSLIPTPSSPASVREGQMLNDSGYSVPGEHDDYRELRAGETRDGMVLSNIVSLRDYIHTKNPNISLDAAADYLMAANSQYQQDVLGITKDKVQPLNLAYNQSIPLPPEWGIGEFRAGDKTSDK